ncbi:MBL fold metallo-hydrolase [bacterium]|nr:MBL fold metallo-hydrolase [bacterium]
MHIKIHRGTHEIGGSCVEVWTESSRLVIDIGMPLVGHDREKFDERIIQDKTAGDLIGAGLLPDIPGLYNPDGRTALLLSHAHQDHYGFLKYIHSETPVYCGEPTQKLIEITGLFSGKKWQIGNPHFIRSGKQFRFNEFQITPYLMDHSAFDAYSFRVDAGGRSLFYSGDFRTHGRKAKAFDWFLRQEHKPLDMLLLEGSTLGRKASRFTSEQEIETELVRIFRVQQAMSLVYSSGQNIDRLVSIFRAVRRSGKILVMDVYVAIVLKTLKEYADLPYPSEDFPEIRVLYQRWPFERLKEAGKESWFYQFRGSKIKKEEISTGARDIVMLVRPSMQGDLENIGGLEGGTFVYSLWDGYQEDPKTKTFLDYLESRGMNRVHLHTSGHAGLPALKQMIKVLQPDRVVPIHTFEGDRYAEVFRDENILRLQDGEEVIL